MDKPSKKKLTFLAPIKKNVAWSQGKGLQSHKYIKREWIGKPKRPWRYFYTQEEYMKYKFKNSKTKQSAKTVTIIGTPKIQEVQQLIKELFVSEMEVNLLPPKDKEKQKNRVAQIQNLQKILLQEKTKAENEGNEEKAKQIDETIQKLKIQFAGLVDDTKRTQKSTKLEIGYFNEKNRNFISQELTGENIQQIIGSEATKNLISHYESVLGNVVFLNPVDQFIVAQKFLKNNVTNAVVNATQIKNFVLNPKDTKDGVLGFYVTPHILNSKETKTTINYNLGTIYSYMVRANASNPNLFEKILEYQKENYEAGTTDIGVNTTYGDPRLYVLATYFHEIAHAIDYSPFKPPRRFSETKIWRDIEKAETDRVSGYANTSPAEDFAETFASMCITPYYLARTCPRRYEFMRVNFFPTYPPAEKIAGANYDKYHLLDYLKADVSRKEKIINSIPRKAYTYVQKSKNDDFFIIHPKSSDRVAYVRIGGTNTKNRTIKEVYDDKGNGIPVEALAYYLGLGSVDFHFVDYNGKKFFIDDLFARNYDEAKQFYKEILTNPENFVKPEKKQLWLDAIKQVEKKNKELTFANVSKEFNKLYPKEKIEYTTQRKWIKDLDLLFKLGNINEGAKVKNTKSRFYGKTYRYLALYYPAELHQMLKTMVDKEGKKEARRCLELLDTKVTPSHIMAKLYDEKSKIGTKITEDEYRLESGTFVYDRWERKKIVGGGYEYKCKLPDGTNFTFKTDNKGIPTNPLIQELLKIQEGELLTQSDKSAFKLLQEKLIQLTNYTNPDGTKGYKINTFITSTLHGYVKMETKPPKGVSKEEWNSNQIYYLTPIRFDGKGHPLLDIGTQAFTLFKKPEARLDNIIDLNGKLKLQSTTSQKIIDELPIKVGGEVYAKLLDNRKKYTACKILGIETLSNGEKIYKVAPLKGVYKENIIDVKEKDIKPIKVAPRPKGLEDFYYISYNPQLKKFILNEPVNYNSRIVDIERVPGIHNIAKKDEFPIYSINMEKLSDIQKLIPLIAMDSRTKIKMELKEKGEEFLKNKKKEEITIKEIKENLLPSLRRTHRISNKVIELAPHQIGAIKKAIENNGRMEFAHFMGTGKTLTAICTNMALKSQNKINKVLVITPPSVTKQWKSEIHNFTEENAVVIGSPQAGADIPIKEVKSIDELPLYTIVNYQYFLVHREEFRRLGFNAVTLDEAHRVKKGGEGTFETTGEEKGANEITKEISKWNDSLNSLLLLTGTPFTNTLVDVNTYLKLLSNQMIDLGTREEFIERFLTQDIDSGKITYPKNPYLLAQYMVKYFDIVTTNDVVENGGKYMPLADSNTHIYATLKPKSIQELVYLQTLSDDAKEQYLSGQGLSGEIKEDDINKIVTEFDNMTPENIKKMLKRLDFLLCGNLIPASNHEYATINEALNLWEEQITTEAEKHGLEKAIERFKGAYQNAVKMPPKIPNRFPSTVTFEGFLWKNYFFPRLKPYLEEITGKTIESYDEIAFGSVTDELGIPPEYIGSSWENLFSQYGIETEERISKEFPSINYVPLGIVDRTKIAKYFKDATTPPSLLELNQKGIDVYFWDDDEYKYYKNDPKLGKGNPPTKPLELDVCRTKEEIEERQKFDDIITQNNVKAEKLGELIDSIDLGTKKNKYKVIFENRIPVGIVAIQSELRKKGYIDIKEAIITGRRSSRGYYAKYMGKTKDKEIYNLIFSRAKNGEILLLEKLKKGELPERLQKILKDEWGIDASKRDNAFTEEQKEALRNTTTMVSSNAGAEGINWGHADTLIEYSFDYNPSNQAQQIARICRVQELPEDPEERAVIMEFRQTLKKAKEDLFKLATSGKDMKTLFDLGIVTPYPTHQDIVNYAIRLLTPDSRKYIKEHHIVKDVYYIDTNTPDDKKIEIVSHSKQRAFDIIIDTLKEAKIQEINGTKTVTVKDKQLNELMELPENYKRPENVGVPLSEIYTHLKEKEKNKQDETKKVKKIKKGIKFVIRRK